MSEHTMADVFYIKTKDKTSFAIYDLTVSEDVDTISFGYNFVEENSLDKSHYDLEIRMIVKELFDHQYVLEIDNEKENT
tara:strand:- start:295 stop:531 length:237 start_codon:yes stop_codon:yes gene_type:complete